MMHNTSEIEIENHILSIGSEFLPAVARKVRDGFDLTAEERAQYRCWLDGQIERMSR